MPVTTKKRTKIHRFTITRGGYVCPRGQTRRQPDSSLLASTVREYLDIRHRRADIDVVVGRYKDWTTLIFRRMSTWWEVNGTEMGFALCRKAVTKYFGKPKHQKRLTLSYRIVT